MIISRDVIPSDAPTSRIVGRFRYDSVDNSITVRGKRAFFVDLNVAPNLKVETALVNVASSITSEHNIRGSEAEGRIWVKYWAQYDRLSLIGNRMLSIFPISKIIGWRL